MGIKCLDQLRDQPRRDQGMVYRTNDDSLRIGREKISYRALYGRKWTGLPIHIDDHLRVTEPELRLNLCRSRAQHHPPQPDPRMLGGPPQIFHKRSAANFHQRLGKSHSPRFARSENRGGQHRYPRRAASGPTSSFLCAAKPSAFRRTAINCATMLTAISSGVSAPISSPTGACTRSNCAAENPSFSSALYTAITLRLLPIIPIYRGVNPRASLPTAHASTRMSPLCPRVTISKYVDELG